MKFKFSLGKFLFGMAIVVLTASNSCEAKSPSAIIGHGNVVKLEVAQSYEQITKGLMYRTSMPEDAGMVFLFDPPQPATFWMYHTLIPLDMLFVKDGKIVKLYEHVPPCKSENSNDCPKYPSGADITEVVEVNGGYCHRHGIHQGDPVFFTLNPLAPAK